jgi:hypothetical protein
MCDKLIISWLSRRTSLGLLTNLGDLHFKMCQQHEKKNHQDPSKECSPKAFFHLTDIRYNLHSFGAEGKTSCNQLMYVRL